MNPNLDFSACSLSITLLLVKIFSCLVWIKCQAPVRLVFFHYVFIAFSVSHLHGQGEVHSQFMKMPFFK